jgi:hypothetical protein
VLLANLEGQFTRNLLQWRSPVAAGRKTPPPRTFRPPFSVPTIRWTPLPRPTTKFRRASRFRSARTHFRAPASLSSLQAWTTPPLHSAFTWAHGGAGDSRADWKLYKCTSAHRVRSAQSGRGQSAGTPNFSPSAEAPPGWRQLSECGGPVEAQEIEAVSTVICLFVSVRFTLSIDVAHASSSAPAAVVSLAARAAASADALTRSA